MKEIGRKRQKKDNKKSFKRFVGNSERMTQGGKGRDDRERFRWKG